MVFILSQYFIGDNALLNTTIGITVYTALYIYAIVYSPESMGLFIKIMPYIVCIDLIASGLLMWSRNGQQSNQPESNSPIIQELPEGQEAIEAEEVDEVDEDEGNDQYTEVYIVDIDSPVGQPSEQHEPLPEEEPAPVPVKEYEPVEAFTELAPEPVHEDLPVQEKVLEIDPQPPVPKRRGRKPKVVKPVVEED